MEAFTEAIKDEDLSPVTVRGYVSDLGTFFAWLKQSRGVRLGLDQISTIHIGGFLRNGGKRIYMLPSMNRSMSVVPIGAQSGKPFPSCALAAHIARDNVTPAGA